MAGEQNTQVVEPQAPETVEEQASNPTQEPEKMVSVVEATPFEDFGRKTFQRHSRRNF